MTEGIIRILTLIFAVQVLILEKSHCLTSSVKESRNEVQIADDIDDAVNDSPDFPEKESQSSKKAFQSEEKRSPQWPWPFPEPPDPWGPPYPADDKNNRTKKARADEHH